MSEIANDDTWKKFADDNPSTIDALKYGSSIASFCKKHTAAEKSIVLVTSGGTTVPLEHNTVRFVDNFSAGTRGSVSTEHFLRSGYAVIFLHRTNTLQPYSRSINSSQLLKFLTPSQNADGQWKIEISPQEVPRLLPVIQTFQKVTKDELLLKIPFTTVSEYLHLLNIAAHVLKTIKRKAMLYLAAAVSDFYIPSSDMATHKISSDEPLNLNLQLVPKILQPLVRYWIPEAFVVSFKLETNPVILVEKAKGALEKYGHKVVIANMLQDYKRRVVLVTPEMEKTICLTDEEMTMGREIEEKIVDELVKMHCTFKAA